MQAGDPRADPAIVDLIELAGLWLAAGDLTALGRTLARLTTELTERYPADEAFGQRFRSLAAQLSAVSVTDRGALEAIRRAYRQAIVG